MDTLLLFINDAIAIINTHEPIFAGIILLTAVLTAGFIWLITALVYRAKLKQWQAQAQQLHTEAQQLHAEQEQSLAYRTQLESQISATESTLNQTQAELAQQSERNQALAARHAQIQEQAEQTEQTLSANLAQQAQELHLQIETHARLEHAYQQQIEQAHALKRQIADSARYISLNIQHCATALNEPVSVMVMTDSVSLWQQHQHIFNRLLARLQPALAQQQNLSQQLQTAYSQINEQTTVINDLQTALSVQTAQNQKLSSELTHTSANSNQDQTVQQLQKQLAQAQGDLHSTKQELQSAQAQVQQLKLTVEQAKTTASANPLSASASLSEHALQTQLKQKDLEIEKLQLLVVGHENHIARLTERYEGRSAVPATNAPTEPHDNKNLLVGSAGVTAVAEQEWQELKTKIKTLPEQMQIWYGQAQKLFKK